MTALRVLICEDSRTYAAALGRVLGYDGDIAIEGVCATAEEAVSALPRVRPDLLTMDVGLPGMGGIEAISEIMSTHPVPILVLSVHVSQGNEMAAAARAAGALEVIAKDDLDVLNPAGEAAGALRQRVRILGRARVIRHLRAGLGGVPGAAGGHGKARRVSVIGMCASVGGPHALRDVLGRLPADYPIPILVVQHIAAGFTDGLAQWLDSAIPSPVALAVHGAPATPGVWVAPEGAHLRLSAPGMLILDSDTSAGQHRPSADVLLRSIAEAAGRAGVAVVLSGMGKDGAAGAAAVRRAGGLAMAQDERSSAVFGMPKSAIDLGVTIVLSPEGIAACLLGLTHERAASPR